MTDRVHPSSKPAANGTTTTATGTAGGGGNPSFPANKAQLYNSTRPAYRPKPRPKPRRSCCCSCCLWTTLILLLLLLLAAISGAILWVLYRPHRPNFSVSSLQISQFNLTSSSQLTSKFTLTITARNPNKKIVYFYDPTAVSIIADGVDVGDGSLPGFTHGTKNTTSLTTVLGTTSQSVVNSDLKNKNSLGLKIRLETKVKVKIGGLKTKKVGLRVHCTGVKATVPTGKAATVAATADTKCKVDLRIKIWKWTI